MSITENSIAENLSIDRDSTRAKVLEKVDPDNFRWSLPIMRTGYAGRGLVYLVVAGFSLWSIAQGGQASGTKSVMETLRGDASFVLILIAVGMFAYALWRLIDCIWDLEAYGRDGKGLIARAGMLVTGLIHGGIGVLALSAFLGSGAGSGDSKGMIATLMASPGGLWIIGGAGVLTLCASVYYIHKAVTEGYRDDLTASPFTTKYNEVLKVGVIAQGVVVGIIGGLIVYAALQASPDQVGGLGAAFEWLRSQPFGRTLVVILCVGLLAFATFCFVNAVYRIVPKAADENVKSLTTYQERHASG